MKGVQEKKSQGVQKKSQGVHEKNHRGCMKKITGGAWIPQGVHEKNFRRASRAEIHAPPGQMSVSAPDLSPNIQV